MDLVTLAIITGVVSLIIVNVIGYILHQTNFIDEIGWAWVGFLDKIKAWIDGPKPKSRAYKMPEMPPGEPYLPPAPPPPPPTPIPVPAIIVPPAPPLPSIFPVAQEFCSRSPNEANRAILDDLEKDPLSEEALTRLFYRLDPVDRYRLVTIAYQNPAHQKVRRLVAELPPDQQEDILAGRNPPPELS